MNKQSVLTWSFLGMLVFQNFDLVQPRFDLFVQAVDEETRTEHAQELLGRSFRGSPAEAVNAGKTLNLAIYEEFRRRLPKTDKWQAGPLANLVIQEAAKYELDPVFIMAVIAQESSFRPRARGPIGEIGLMQLRPETAAWVAGKHGIPFHGPKTLEQPYVNIKIGIAYVADLRESFKGRAAHYVSAYNMGAKSVRRMVANRQTPKEYSGKVMKKYHDLYASIMKRGVLIAKAEAH
jgi:soluble lytic murein transglycosylase